MLKDNLFENVLIKPAIEDGADRLLIVSGYATPKMARWHLNTLADNNKNISVELIIGMVNHDGIEHLDHHDLRTINQWGVRGSSLTCHYVVEGNPVHIKVYIWLKNNKPIKAFMGSANYTKTAFSQSQDEVLMECPLDSAQEIFNNCMEMSASCEQEGIETQIKITTKRTPVSDVSPLKL